MKLPDKEKKKDALPEKKSAGAAPGEIKKEAVPKESSQPQARGKKKSAILAAILGLVPGLGLIYAGLLVHGIIVFFTFWLIIPYCYGIINAIVTVNKVNRGEPYGAKVGLFFSILSGLVLIIFMFIFIRPIIVNSLYTGVPVKISPGQNTAAVNVLAKQTVITPIVKSTVPVVAPAEEVPWKGKIEFFEITGDLPIYPGSSMQGTIMRENYTGFKFSTGTDIKNVVSFYKTNLAKYEYLLNSSDYTNEGDAVTLSFIRKNLECTIRLYKNENGSTAGLIAINQ